MNGPTVADVVPSAPAAIDREPIATSLFKKAKDLLPIATVSLEAATDSTPTAVAPSPYALA